MRIRRRLVSGVLAAIVVAGLTGIWATSALSREGDPSEPTKALSDRSEQGVPVTDAEKEQYLDFESRYRDDRGRDDALDNQGGPDAFHYVFTDNVSPDSVPYAWIELRGDSAATWLRGLTGFTSITDGYSRQKLPIGFFFPFYGATYDCVRVATNGFLQFTTTATWLNNGCLPSTLVAGPMIAVLWDDLHLLRGGRTDTLVVGYKSFGTHMVIEFDQIGFFSSSCPNVPLKFEAVLYPNGDIKLQYNSIPIPTACANSQTIGIQQGGAAGSAALNYVCNTTGIQPANGRAILFSRPSSIPNPPASFTATYNRTTGNVVLAWQDPTQDTEGNPITIDSVQVWVGAVESGQFLATVPRGVQTYTEASPPLGPRLYCVRAYRNPYHSVAVSCSVMVSNPNYLNDFEADNGGWVADPPTGGWEWPTPPYAAPHSGNNVWGTVGPYPSSACLRLTLSPELMVQSPAATIEFWRWFSIQASYDGCNFFVSVDNGNTWELVEPTEGGYTGSIHMGNACNHPLAAWTGSGTSWTHVTIPIGQFVGQVPQFRFVFGSDGYAVVYPGFYFDDMSIWGLQPPSSIAGTVRAFITNLPIAGARVWATDWPDTAVTDATGSYELSIDPGTYSVTFDHVHFCDSTHTNVVVVSGQQTTRNAILRRPQAQINRTSITLLTLPGVDVSDTFRISNNGGQCPLDFAITDTSDWLTTTPESGTVNPNESVTITVNAIAPQIVGDYSSSLMVSYNAVGTPSVIHVDLSIVVAAGERSVIPTEFAYYQNYPNPFNATTALRFDVPQQSRVQIAVFNIMGQEVARPVERVYAPGRYRVLFDAAALPSGMYLVRMSAADYTKIGKMMLLK